MWKEVLGSHVIPQKELAYDQHFSDVHLPDFLDQAETSFHIGVSMAESQDELGNFCDGSESTDPQYVKKILIHAILITIKFWC